MFFHPGFKIPVKEFSLGICQFHRIGLLILGGYAQLYDTRPDFLVWEFLALSFSFCLYLADEPKQTELNGGCTVPNTCMEST